MKNLTIFGPVLGYVVYDTLTLYQIPLLSDNFWGTRLLSLGGRIHRILHASGRGFYELRCAVQGWQRPVFCASIVLLPKQLF